MMSTRILIAGAALATLCAAGEAMAAPTVLREDQLRDLAVTPVLGRGYSLATGTFQSICLTDIARTKPSYNFYYRFEQLDASGKITSTTSTSVAGSVGGGKLGVRVKVGGAGKQTVIEGRTYTDQHIVVTTDVEVYYSSVDESKARLGDAARELLTASDIPGFFDACGMHYVRSIGRRASFVSVFTYKTEDGKRDAGFEARLEAELKGWGLSASVDVERSRRFVAEAASKFLTIESTAFGLGKDDRASLIAYDLTTFRQALKDAFVAMQQEDTGLVISMEVVPWVENADFQRILKLGTAKKVDGGRTISPYAQKRILSQNGEFLAEVDRAARAKLNVYYKAKQCRASIDLDFRDPTGAALAPEYADRKIINHRNGRTLALAELDKALSAATINRLFDEHRAFLYGDGGASGGAVACVRDLLDGGISVRSHREVPSCTPVEQSLAVNGGRIVDEFCMPELAD